MTPTDLRALAARVLGEEPSDELRNAVLVALGWRWSDFRDGMFDPDGTFINRHYFPTPLTSLDAAASAMPAGWIVIITTAPGKNCTVDAARDYGDGPEPDPENWITASAEAPTEPRARTAAALRAMAAEASNG